jgi:hypothetical protein
MTFAGPIVPPPASAATPRAEGEAPARPNEEPRPAATPRPIRLVANEVIARGLAKLMARTADTAQRISVRGGLIGLGSYTPRGGADYGMKAPPRHLFPAAGVGGSLNVDPNTGRSYFTNTP